MFFDSSKEQKVLLTNSYNLKRKSQRCTNLKKDILDISTKKQKFDLYDDIFKHKNPLYTTRHHFVNNKLNLIYAENEHSFRNIMKNKKSFQVLTRESANDMIEQKVSYIKNNTIFMKRIIDYVYPTLLNTKNSTRIHKAFSILPSISTYRGVNENAKKQKNELKKYLFKSISITKP